MPGVAEPTHDPGADRLESDPTRRVRRLHPSHAATEAVDVLLDQQPVRREDPVTQKADALVAREHDTLVPVDLEPEAFEELADLVPNLVETPLVVGEDEEIIDVADVAQPEPVGDEVVERVEVDVGEELAGLVAQREATPTLDGREQVVAGEPGEDRSCGLLWSMIRFPNQRTCGSLILRATRPLRISWSIDGKNLRTSAFRTYRKRRANSWQRSTAACVPLPLRQA